MIYKSFHKCKARAENYDHSHCYASCDPKTENYTGSYVHTAFAVYSTEVTLGNYLSNKLRSMVFFDITVFLGLPGKNNGKRRIPG